MCFMCVYKQTPPEDREALVEAFFNAAGDVLNEALDDGESPADDARFAAKAQILADMIRGYMPGQPSANSRLSDILTQLFKDAMSDGDGNVDFTKLKGKTVVVPVKINSGDSLETIQAKTKAAMAGPFPTSPVNVGNTPSVNLGADFEFPDGKWPANNVFPLKPTKH